MDGAESMLRLNDEVTESREGSVRMYSTCVGGGVAGTELRRGAREEWEMERRGKGGRKSLTRWNIGWNLEESLFTIRR